MRPCLGGPDGDRCPELVKPPNRRCPEHRTEAAKRKQLLGLTGERGSTRRWRKLRARVIRRDQGRCTNRVEGKRCLNTTNLHVHHRDGDAMSDRLDNLQTLCRDCHLEVEKAKAAT